MPETARQGMESPASGAAQGSAQGAIPIGGVVALLAGVAAVSLLTIGILAVAAATGAESLFNFIAWLLPSMGVGFSLVIALVGTIIVRRLIKDQASGSAQDETAEADEETTKVGTQDVASQATDEEGQVVLPVQGVRGHTMTILQRDAEGNIVGRVEQVYDSQGNMVTFLRTDAEGNVVGRADLVYDSQGNLLAARHIPEPTIGEELGEEPVEVPSWEDYYRQFMDDISSSKVAEKGDETVFPIEGYDEMNVEEVSERLNDLSAEELQLVRDYEERNKRRDTLLEQMDRKIRTTPR